MPMFTIERTYLASVFQHVTVDAPDVGATCVTTLDENAHSRNDNKVDFESARATTVFRAWVGATTYDGQ